MHTLAGSILRIVIAALLLAATLPCQRLLLKLRTDSCPYRPEELQDAPPSVAFTTVALGSARGIVADLLWLRSFDMQADGRYFELTQLARWITALAGSEPETWIQQAWNLTYNIPPILANPEERWHWVHAGIDLLRRDGMLNAPHPSLFAELSFFHADKLGGNVDPSSSFYSQRFAEGIAPFLTTDGQLPESDSVRLLKLAETYRLVPTIIQQLESRYPCKLDWRNPHAHAAYWAFRGKLASPPNAPSKRCDRLFYQSLESLYGSGLRTSRPLVGTQSIDPSFFLAATKAHGEAADAHPTDTTLAPTHAGFLQRATLQLAAIGESTLAQQAYRELKRRYPELAPAADYNTFISTKAHTAP
jgi:hypothetical protein